MSADLTSVSSADLRAELARRQQAAKAKGKPLKHSTKAEWAEAKRIDACEALAAVRSETVAGEHARRKRAEQESFWQGEIRKFENLAKKYRREGV